MRRGGRGVVPNLVKGGTSTSSQGPYRPRAGAGRMGGGSGGPNFGENFGTDWGKVGWKGLRGAGAAAGGAVATYSITEVIDKAGETHQMEYEMLKISRAINPGYRDRGFNSLEEVLNTKTGEIIRNKYGEQGCGVLLNKVKKDFLGGCKSIEDWNFSNEELAKAVDMKGYDWNLKESRIGESKVTRELRKVLEDAQKAEKAELARLREEVIKNSRKK